MFKSLNNNTKNFFISTFMIYLVTMGVFFNFAGIFLKEKGFLEGFVGKTLSVTTLSIAMFSVISSFLITNYGYKKIIITGIILISAGLVGLALSGSSPLIIISSVILGAGFSIHMTGEGAFITGENNEEDRVRIFSYCFALKNLGIILGSLLGGRFSDLLGSHMGRVNSMRLLFILCGISLLYSIRPINKIIENKEKKRRSIERFIASYRDVCRGRVFKFILYNSTVGLGAGMVVPFFAVYLKYTLNTDNTVVGIILSIAQMGCVIGGLLVPLLVKYMGRERTVIVCQLLSIPFLISIAFPQGMVALTLSFLMRSTLMNLNNPINQNLSMEMVDEGKRSLLSSVFALSSNFTRALGIIVGGWMMENISYNSPYYVTIVLYLIGTYTFYRIFGMGKPPIFPTRIKSPVK